MKFDILLIIFLIPFLKIHGTTVENNTNLIGQKLEIFASFSHAVLKGDIDDFIKFVRFPENMNLTELEISTLILNFLQEWREVFISLEKEEKVVITLDSTDEDQFKISIINQFSVATNDDKNPELPVLESVVLLGEGDGVNYKSRSVININFRKDSVGWFFDYGHVSSSSISE